MKASVFMLFAICVAASVVSGAGEPSTPLLDRDARETVIAAALQAVQKHKRANQNAPMGTEIAKALWADPIARLKPLRVRDDFWHNVLIILKEDDASEEGLYVYNRISSYRPGHDVRFLAFEKLTQTGDAILMGEVYRCKLRKAQPVGASTRSHPGSAQTNRTSSAAGSVR